MTKVLEKSSIGASTEVSMDNLIDAIKSIDLNSDMDYVYI